MPSMSLVFDDRVIPNPNQGIQVTQRAPVLTDQFQSTVAYIKFYAADLVRADGSYNFAPVLAQLDACKTAGARMGTRVAIIDPAGYDSPAVWQSKFPHITFTSADSSPPNSKTLHFPDTNNSAAVAELQKFYGSLFLTIKNHPALAAFDLYYWGLWGEGHFSACKLVSTGAPVPLPPINVRQNHIDQVISALPGIMYFACLDDNAACAYALTKGAGWRQDGVGNPPHMQTLIPQWIAATAAQKSWTAKPIAVEIYSNLAGWISSGYNLDDKFNELLRYGVSLIHAKTVNPPAAAQAAVTNFLKRCGLQLFISKFSYPDAVYAGQPAMIEVTVENHGAAPSYKALKLELDGGTLELPTLYPGESFTAPIIYYNQAAGPSQVTAKLWHGPDPWRPANAAFDPATGKTVLGTIQVQETPPAPPESAPVLWKKFRQAIEA